MCTSNIHSITDKQAVQGLVIVRGAADGFAQEIVAGTHHFRADEPARLPWKSLGVDIVFECTGAFTRREDLDAHIRAGARFVTRCRPNASPTVAAASVAKNQKGR